MKNSKRLLLTTIFLTTLLSLSAYASQAPNAHAAEMTTQEKSLSILEEVAGFNMTAYAPFLQAEETDQFLSSTQKEADFILMSNTSKLRVRCSFIGDHLRQIFISDLSGEPFTDEPSTDAIANAEGLLERYQSYTSDPVYGELKSMLDAVNIGENVTKTEGNVQLKVSVIGQSWTDFMWTYVDENGVPAVSKNVVLNYREGMLKIFLDNWDLYRIAAEPVLSSSQAVTIALDAVKDYSWTVENTENGTVTVSDFKTVAVGNTSLCYLNYREGSAIREGDPFTLYPSWYVPLGFDKIYPGCVTGVTVRVWADTEVSGISLLVSGGEQLIHESLNSEVGMWVTVTIGIAGIFVAYVYLGIRRNKSSALKVVGKLGLSKLFGGLLCLLISIEMVLAVVPLASAFPDSNGKSMVYASTWGQNEDELAAASEVCNYIASNFSAAGYNVTNAFGTGTTEEVVLGNASSM